MPVEELTQVVLDGECQSQTIVGLDSLTACEELSIQGCGIASLDNFPNLQALRKLLLADNRIGGGLQNLAKLTNLEELSIGGNKVASLDELKPLVDLKLTAIDLEGCPCADGSDTYRSAVFAMWPTLVFLDGTDVDGNERLIDDEDSEDEDEDEEEDFDDDDEEDEDDFDDDEEDDDDDDDGQVAGLSAGIDEFDSDDEDEEEEELGTANLMGPPMEDDDEDDFEGGDDPDSEDFDDEEDDDDDEDEEPAKKARVE